MPVDVHMDGILDALRALAHELPEFFLLPVQQIPTAHSPIVLLLLRLLLIVVLLVTVGAAIGQWLFQNVFWRNVARKESTVCLMAMVANTLIRNGLNDYCLFLIGTSGFIF